MKITGTHFFELLWKQEIGTELVKEYKFHPTRKWRFDYADLNNKIAYEVDGGLFKNGRHNRASGFIKDCEKFCYAALLGWRVIRIPSHEVAKYVDMIKKGLP